MRNILLLTFVSFVLVWLLGGSARGRPSTFARSVHWQVRILSCHSFARIKSQLKGHFTKTLKLSFRDGEIWELQLKGSGKTPYSRCARIILFSCLHVLVVVCLPAHTDRMKWIIWNVGQGTVEPSSVPQWGSSCAARPCISSASPPAEPPGETDMMTMRIDSYDWRLVSQFVFFAMVCLKKRPIFCSSNVILSMTLLQSHCQWWACAEGSVLQWQCEDRKRCSDAGNSWTKLISYSWTPKDLFPFNFLMKTQEPWFSVLPSRGFELDLWKSCLKAKR